MGLKLVLDFQCNAAPFIVASMSNLRTFVCTTLCIFIHTLLYLINTVRVEKNFLPH